MIGVVSLDYDEIRAWMEAASKWTKAGLRVFAQQGPIVHVAALVAALEEEGSDKYSQFQSRTTARTRTVTGGREAYLLGWSYEDDGEKGRYAVTRQTYKSLRRYFGLKNGEESTAYSGTFTVEGDAFLLNAKRLIVRDTEVAFELSGKDEEFGQFTIEGTSRETILGRYESGILSYNYKGAGNSYLAEIRFSRVDRTLEGCEIEGEWHEEGGWSRFSGHLEPFEA